MSSDIQAAIYGGSMIALSSSLMYVLYGRITGLSGILNTCLSFNIKSTFFFLCFSFITGLITFVKCWIDNYSNNREGAPLIIEKDNLSTLGWMLGGFLIGVGSRWSGGCTSGHGVCGLPRFSARSLVAICIFMPVGIITATYLHSNPIFFTNAMHSKEFYDNYKYFTKILFGALQVSFGFISLYYTMTKNTISEKLLPFANFIIGGIFGYGLLISGMCSREKILSFLAITPAWNPSLLFVMFTAVFINLITFQSIIHVGKPLLAENLARPNTGLDIGSFIGPILFGAGWGITGLCPGPAIATFLFNPNSLLLIITIFAGQKIVDTCYDLAYYLEKKNN